MTKVTKAQKETTDESMKLKKLIRFKLLFDNARNSKTGLTLANTDLLKELEILWLQSQNKTKKDKA